MFDTIQSMSYVTPAQDSSPATVPDRDAFFDLGLAYACGHGEPVDLIRAHKWFNIAAMLGNARAREERAEIAELMNPLEIAEAQRAAREWVLSSREN